MGVRTRIVVLSGVAVALAVVAAAVGSYVVVRSELLGQIDDSLSAQAEVVQEVARTDLPDELPGGDLPGPPPAAPPATQQGVRIQHLTAEGTVDQLGDSTGQLPVDDAARQIAARGSGSLSQDLTVDGERFRVLTVGIGDDGAMMLGRSLAGVNDVLADLRLILSVLVLAGVGLATGLALLVGRRVVRPIRELTETAEHISETSDLGRRIEVQGSDEVARLAERFNAMLDAIAERQQALERSVTSQRQLVADASHELRTPVAAARTDIEALLEHPELSPADRAQILVSADARIEELSDLVLDVIELARDEVDEEEADQVRLDLIAADSVARLRSLAPGRSIKTAFTPTVIEGRPDRLYRAINNLLDNADKYSPPEGRIEVTVAHGVLEVTDQGPGIAEADLPRLFDRFWRGSSARDRPGSGLGLAIVRQVAEAAGGEASARNLKGRGACFRLSFPPSEAEPEVE